MMPLQSRPEKPPLKVRHHSHQPSPGGLRQHSGGRVLLSELEALDLPPATAVPTAIPGVIRWVNHNRESESFHDLSAESALQATVSGVVRWSLGESRPPTQLDANTATTRDKRKTPRAETLGVACSPVGHASS